MGFISSLPSHGVVLRMLTLVLLLLVTHVQLFSWHGAFQTLVSAQNRHKASSQGAHQWYPSTFWWRDRKRIPSIEGDFSSEALASRHGKHKSRGRFGVLRTKEVHHGPHYQKLHIEIPEAEQAEMDNRISNLAPSSPFAFSGGFITPGWGFLRPNGGRSSQALSQPPNYVSLHFSSPVFESQAMNRRGEMRSSGFGPIEEDEEVLSNVIREVVQDLQKGPAASAKADPANFAPIGSKDKTTAEPENSNPSQEVKLPTGTVGHPADTREDITANDNVESKPNSRTMIDFSPSFETVPSEDDGFGAFVEQGSPDFGGFGPPIVFGPPIPVEPLQPVQPAKPVQDFFGRFEPVSKHHPKPHSHDGFHGSGTFMNGAPQQKGLSPLTGLSDPSGFGWGEVSGPASQGFSGDEGGFGSPTGFVQEDKDCDTILTKSCRNDLECTCYGFYYCHAGRCRELTDSANSGAMSFGDKWHDGPAETLGITGRG